MSNCSCSHFVGGLGAVGPRTVDRESCPVHRGPSDTNEGEKTMSVGYEPWAWGVEYRVLPEEDVERMIFQPRLNLDPERTAKTKARAMNAAGYDFARAVPLTPGPGGAGSTHWESCWDAGPRHYGCAIARVEKLEGLLSDMVTRASVQVAPGRRSAREMRANEQELRSLITKAAREVL